MQFEQFLNESKDFEKQSPTIKIQTEDANKDLVDVKRLARMFKQRQKFLFSQKLFKTISYNGGWYVQQNGTKSAVIFEKSILTVDSKISDPSLSVLFFIIDGWIYSASINKAGFIPNNKLFTVEDFEAIIKNQAIPVTNELEIEEN